MTNPQEATIVHKTIYDEGKQHHWFLVGPADDGKSDLLKDVERIFRELEKKFNLPTGSLVFRWSRNGDQKGYRGAPIIV